MTRAASKTGKSRATAIFEILKATYGIPKAFLNHDTPFQLLVATILSAQCTDERINKVTPALFKQFPDSNQMAAATHNEVFEHIKSVSYGNTKAKNIIATAQMIEEKFNGIVPDDIEKLVQLPGVGRKTANVVLGQHFSQPGITVDTHVNRLSHRLQFSSGRTAEKIEQDLMRLWSKSIWTDFSTVLILHARRVCVARKPKCGECPIATLCPSFNLA